MLEIEIDGKKAQVQDGSTVMDAAHQVGVYIPHFCYHKKLSIAANCRMCLVQVEKAPKPLPACATPVTNGMKVFTHSELAVKAQKGVMEFLLINHPLDCPICDQGGECQLQDLAVGYGKGESRYQEEKHVVFHKNVGPLISMEEMSRCIHCTRCVRFGQEIAGIMELGMANRNYHSEITTFMGRTVDSELSGNAIDLCPVGALTSKPFRYSARTWEMQRRRSVSPHDALGANLTIQVKNNKVMRVLPFENEEVNECWISDKDRFSYTALNSAERLTKPMVKQGGQWQEVDWNVAIDYVAHGLKDIAKNAGPDALGFLVSPHATLEEMALVRKLAEGLGSSNYDFRLRQQDFAADQQRAGTPWLGMRLAAVNELDSALVVGSFLRKDAPLFAQRLRQGAKKGCAVSLLDVSADDQLLPVANRQTVAPADLAGALAKVLKAALQAKGEAIPEALQSVEVDSFATQVAASLSQGEKAAVFLGSAGVQGHQASQLHALAQQLAQVCGATLGFIGEAANSVGGYLAGLASKNANAQSLLASGRQAYFLLGAEPEYDFANPAQTLVALKGAQMVVMASAFKHGPALDYADVLLPIAPFTETSGTFVNTEGRVQSFHGVVPPLEEARPAWKVLRVLGNVLSLSGFEYESSEEVRDEVLGQGTEFAAGLDNGLTAPVALNLNKESGSTGLQRIADVPIHFADPLARRSQPLVQTKDGAAPKARLHPSTAATLGLQDGDQAKLKQGAGEAVLTVALDEAIPAGCVRVSAAHATTASLGDMYGPVVMERA